MFFHVVTSVKVTIKRGIALRQSESPGACAHRLRVLWHRISIFEDIAVNNCIPPEPVAPNLATLGMGNVYNRAQKTAISPSRLLRPIDESQKISCGIFTDWEDAALSIVLSMEHNNRIRERLRIPRLNSIARLPGD